jgi:hypothetical protein
MTAIEDIEKAVARLAPNELAKFRAWFEEFDAARFDAKLEPDAKAGRLDRLADEALAEFRTWRARAVNPRGSFHSTRSTTPPHPPFTFR